MTAAIIHATSRPLVGIAAIDNPPPPPVLPTLNDITATTSFNIPLAEGALLVAPTGAMTAGSTYAITPNDGRVAVQGGAYVRGSAAWTTAGVTVFTVVETYTGVTGTSVSRTSTLTVTSVAPVVVVPGFATVVDAVGRNTRSGVKIGQLPAGATLSGTNATHFNVDALGQVTVSAAGQTAGLASSYNMTVVGGGSITTMAFNTLANTFTVTNATELEAAFNVAKLTTNIDWKLAIPTGTTINSPAVLVAPQNVITRRYIELKGAMMDGTIVDDNKNLTPQDVDPKGFTSMSGGNAGTSLWAGLNGKQAYNPNAVASVSGGSITIYCPTTLAAGGAKMNAMVFAQDCRPLRFENIDFCLMSAVDMYDSKATAPVYVTREAVISVTSVSSAGGVLAVNFDDAGAGYPPGWVVGINKKSGTGTGLSGSTVVKADGTLDPTKFTIKAAGSAHTTASKLQCFEIRVWDPPQPTDSPQFPAYNPVNNSFGKFYQFVGQSTNAVQEGSVPNDYSSFVIKGCRFGIGGRSDKTPFRVNRTVNIITHNHLVVEDCLFDFMWIGIGHAKWQRTDMRRNAFINYTNDIIDTYPTTPNAIPGQGNARYSELPAGLRAEALMFVTDNYIGRPEQSSLLMSNSHSDGHQHGAGGDLQTQNILYANNILNMNATSTYMVTQGYFDNGNSTAPKRAKVKFNFCAASSTNSLNFSVTATSDPLGTLIENNFSTRTVYSAADFGSGVDGIGGAVNPMGLVQGATIRRNVIKEVWDMGPGNGGRIAFNPPGGIMMGQLSSTPSPTSTEPRTYRPDPVNQPNLRLPTGPIYISDNYYISYLTPNTGADNSYPEIFKGVNAIGQGPAFIWNATLGISGPAAGQFAIGFHRWWESVRDTPATTSWTDTWAAMARAKADIQSIFTPQAGSGADGRHCFPAEAF